MWAKPICLNIDDVENLCLQTNKIAKQKFLDLLIKNKIDFKKNKELSTNYYICVKKNKKLTSNIKFIKVIRWFLIIFFIFPFFLLTKKVKNKQEILDASLKHESDLERQLIKQLSNVKADLSTHFAYKEIIEKYWSDIKLNLFIPFEWYGIFNKNIEQLLPKSSNDKFLSDCSCAYKLVNGTLFNHPFSLYSYKHQSMYMKIYTGFTTVTYSYTGSDGKSHTGTDVVTASIEKPAARWAYKNNLAYFVSKPSELCFSNNTSKHEFQASVIKEYRQLENHKFNKMFIAKRNNETQYRMLFTPLAQEQYVNLLHKLSFSIAKEKSIVSVEINNLSFELTSNYKNSYDVEQWQINYLNCFNDFLKALSTYTLPIACLPVLKDFAFEYTPNKTDQFCYFQVMSNMAYLYEQTNKYSQYETDVIFVPISNERIKIANCNFDVTKVLIKYFSLINRVDYVPQYSFHAHKTVIVPVHWIEYIPKTKVEFLLHASLDKNYVKQEFVFNNSLFVYSGQILKLLPSSQLNKNDTEDIKKLLKLLKISK